MPTITAQSVTPGSQGYPGAADQAILDSLNRSDWHVASRLPINDDSGAPTGTSQWTIAGPNGQVDTMVVDASGKVLSPPTKTPEKVTPEKPAAVSAPASEQYLLVRDPTSGAVSAQANPNYNPSGNQPRTTVQANGGIYERQTDGTYKQVIAPDKAPRVIGGTASTDQYMILEDSTGNRQQIVNPNYVAPRGTQLSTGSTDQYIVTRNPDGTTSQTLNPNYVKPKPTQVGANSADQFIVQQNPDGTTSQIPNPNYIAPKPVLAAGGTPADQYIVTLGADGNFTSTANPNYKAPPPAQIQPDATAPFILQSVYDPETKTWSIKQVPNPNQVTVQAGLFDFFDQLQGKLGNGQDQIPLEEAKALATAGYQAYTAQTSRQQQLDQGAQTGESILNNRQAATDKVMGDTLGMGINNPHFGLGSVPDVTGLPAAASAYTTMMGGGQGVYDSAANMIHAANPALKGTPQAGGFAAILQQVNDKIASLGGNPAQPAGDTGPAATGPAPQQGAEPSGVTLSGPAQSGSSYAQPLRSGRQVSLSGPVTTIAPDGTVTLQHAGPVAA